MKLPPERLRFLLAWGAYPKGAIITPTGVMRDHFKSLVWYGRRVVEVVEEPVLIPVPAVAPPAAPVETPEPSPVPFAEVEPDAHQSRKTKKRGQL